MKEKIVYGDVNFQALVEKAARYEFQQTSVDTSSVHYVKVYTETG